MTIVQSVPIIDRQNCTGGPRPLVAGTHAPVCSSLATPLQFTELCLKTTYFQFEDHFFEQIDGAAMRSPFLLIVANLYMETFERKVITLAIASIRLWLRYADQAQNNSRPSTNFQTFK